MQLLHSESDISVCDKFMNLIVGKHTNRELGETSDVEIGLLHRRHY